MIKKFEEFINENYSSTGGDFYKRLKVLFCDTLGLENGHYEAMRRRLDDRVYTFEEVEEIVSRLSVLPSVNHMLSLMKNIFDENLDIKEKNEVLDSFSKYNDNKPLPLVIDINDKVLTGKVYYCDALDAYAEDEDDYIDAGTEWLSVKAEDEGIVDDNQPDWVGDHWDWLDIYEVDLDKEYLDKKLNKWVNR